jgi:DNA-binding transcriptional regulator YbjK
VTTRTTAHRASAQRRRASLLVAAADLAAELGAGSVTHRAVAARAGVPLSTTSYFFESISDLVAEALATGAEARVVDFDHAERLALLGNGALRDRLEEIGSELQSSSRTTQAGIVEYYLAAGRSPGGADGATDVAQRLADRVGTHLVRAGAPQADVAARAVVALADGATLHHLAGIRGDDATVITDGLRLLLAASMLSSDEIDALLDRYDQPVAADPA